MNKMHGFIGRAARVCAFVFILSLISLALTGCDVLTGFFGGEDAPKPKKPAVTGVTVMPSVPGVARGEQRQFTATVKGTGDIDQAVVWSVEAVEGGKAEETAISDEGLLTVAEEESAVILTVRAVSVADSAKSGTATVTLYDTLEEVPTVTQVAVSPNPAFVVQGGTEPFTAEVSGDNEPAQTVAWRVEGGSAGTGIDENGLLTVAEGESAASFVVRAVSQVDDNQSGTAAVTVYPLGTEIPGVIISPQEAGVAPGTEQLFTAVVPLTGDQTVTWDVEGANHDGTTITGGLLTVAGDETAQALTVRAVSFADNSKTGTAAVTVYPEGEVPAVTGVTVNEQSQTVERGANYTFTATVAGDNNPPETVTWTIETGGIQPGTSMNGTSGQLYVSDNETNASIVIRATSTYNPAQSGTATVTVPQPIVTGVNVSPASQTVTRGANFAFSAAVNGDYYPPQEVTWSIEPSGTPSYITDGGQLYVSDNETNATLIIRATSTYTPAHSGTATVTVPQPIVTGVNVYPASQTIARGANFTFFATVNGDYYPPQGVTWTIETGGIQPETSINGAGRLDVSANETNTTLTIRATSTYDNTQSDTATVTVPPPIVTGVNVSPASQTVTRGANFTFSAAVNGDYYPPQGVTWTIEPSGTPSYITDGGQLYVSANETNTPLTIRATSTYSTAHSGIATVTVPQPTVTGVNVSPASQTIARGSYYTFSAAVNGDYYPPQEVTWTIETGGIQPGTSINGAGRLDVSASETNTTLTIRATSTYNQAYSGTATVVVVAPPGMGSSIKVKFNVTTEGAAGVTVTFNALHNFIMGGGLSSQPDMIQLGDWIDLEGGLTVEAYGTGSYTGGFTASNSVISASPFDGYEGTLLRLIVVGINSFQTREGYSYAPPPGSDHNATPHVVFQFQNLPGERRMNPANIAGGYRDSEMRKYLSTTNGAAQNGNFLLGLVAAGVPQSVLWAPKRYVSAKEDTGPSEINDLLWLPTEREMLGENRDSVVAHETASNQARLEYYTGNDRRRKFGGGGGGMHYWLSSPYLGSPGPFCFIALSTGGPGMGGAANGLGIAPAFCVK